MSKTLIAALAASTILASGAVWAATDASPTPPPGHAAMMKDFSKLSSDASRAYQDLTLTRLAIFDGHTKDAKMLIDQADAAFGKAKTDDSVFTKAEAEMRTHMAKAGNAGSTADADKSDKGDKQASAQPAAGATSDVNTPKAWLPVDGAVSVAEDFTTQPAKAKAVADANKSLAKGDRKGAMDKLKLAGVDLDLVMAVVPLQQTLTDVHAAAQLIDSGKYYEGSQKIRAVQDRAIYVVNDMSTVPTAGKANTSETANKADSGKAGDKTDAAHENASGAK